MRDKLFDSLSDLDGLCAELEDVKNLFVIYKECTSKDLEPIYKGEPWGDKYLLNRASLHESMFSTILRRLDDICTDMQKSVSAGYECQRESISNQAQ